MSMRGDILDLGRLHGCLRILCNLGYALTLTADYRAAALHIESSFDEATRRFGERSLARAEVLNLRGLHHKLQGRYALAKDSYQEAVALCEQGGMALPLALVHNLAGLACAMGDYERAVGLSEMGIAALLGCDGSEGPKQQLALASELAGLADAQSGLGLLTAAANNYREALNLYSASGRERHPEVAYALHNLADALAQLGDAEEAQCCYREAISKKEAAFGAFHPEVAASLNNLAALLWTVGQPEAALAASGRALAIVDGLDPDHFIRQGCEQLAAQLNAAEEQRRAQR
jgi:tetratricopeptide (TPR) repeat protein